MIIREHEDSFVMIEQDHHAAISSKFFSYWKNDLFQGTEHREIVQQAIRYHDYGWKYFDKQPFWDDKKNQPYDFNSFPMSAKTMIYQHGINELEKIHPYAALLCSMHYSNFMKNVQSDYADHFVQTEKQRQQRLLDNTENLNKSLIYFHYEILAFMDSLSLYICLNEPEAKDDDIHFFFKKGIRLPSNMEHEILNITWQDSNILFLHPFPFQKEFSVYLRQKNVKKKEIHDNGLIPSYENTPYDEILYRFAPKK